MTQKIYSTFEGRLLNGSLWFGELCERSVPLMKLIDFRHVAKQNVLLAEQVAGDEVSHGRVVHLCCIALELNITCITSTDSLNRHPPNDGMGPTPV